MQPGHAPWRGRKEETSPNDYAALAPPFLCMHPFHPFGMHRWLFFRTWVLELSQLPSCSRKKETAVAYHCLRESGTSRWVWLEVVGPFKSFGCV